jgi:hypothetical protein
MDGRLVKIQFKFEFCSLGLESAVLPYVRGVNAWRHRQPDLPRYYWKIDENPYVERPQGQAGST